MIGRTLSHYKVLDEISRGGMGVVYRALDVKLNREVALKVLPPELVADTERRARFVQEAQAAAALKHPNIGVIYEIDEGEGTTFIAMELIEGESLSELLAKEPLPVASAIALARQIADGLGQAHEKGIIHRDLKPANVMITGDGHAKVIDFGLAKLLESFGTGATEAETAVRAETRSGALMGTVHYMSPEQALGRAVDARSDLFSLGVMLYEMATGSKPFDGDTVAAVFDAILHQSPVPPGRLNDALPRGLQQIIERLLEKDPESRFQSTKELSSALERLASDRSAGLFERLRQPRWAIPTVAVSAVLLFLVVRSVQRSERARWAREEALPEIVRLIEDEEFTAAFDLAAEAEAYIPNDPMLANLRPEFTRRVSIETTPEGADVYFVDYEPRDDERRHLGKTPIDDVPIPRGYFQWSIVKDGYQTTETFGSSPLRSRTLDKEGNFPPEMVRIDAGPFSPDFFLGLENVTPVQLGTYWMDRHEVTNRQFKEFVDAGGYRDQRYWKHEFSKDGRTLTWEEAIAELVDATGRPGPATWELGDYTEGKDDYPVTGVSWYEAAAYAEFAGKSLPTLYHWGHAAGWLGKLLGDHLVPFSNFDSGGIAPVRQYRGRTSWGLYDMAGNVKEWCWNESGSGRYIVGGGWDEPAYMFAVPDAQLPFRRMPNYGFRCMRRVSDEKLPDAVKGVIPIPHRDADEEPINASVLEIYKRLFSYDRTELNPAVELTDDSAEHWSLEKISFDASYGNERVTAYLYLPRKFRPPHQTVIYYPGAEAIFLRSSEALAAGPSRALPLRGGVDGIDFLVKTGRAVLYPIYQGTFERGGELSSTFPNQSTLYRDHMIMWGKDLGRSIDYLESRSELDGTFAYYGFSWGAALGAIHPALEQRLSAAVLVGGGFFPLDALPEVDQATYAPFVTVPTLMLNGRYDFSFPLELSQKTMFDRLGTPVEQKRHVVFETGHSVPRREAIGEILDWLDKYLGPVS